VEDDDARSPPAPPAPPAPPTRGRWSRATAEAALPGMAASDASPAGSAFDPPRERFAIGDELGRGGMGRVLAATDVALQRPVAIKQLLRRDGDGAGTCGDIALG